MTTTTKWWYNDIDNIDYDDDDDEYTEYHLPQIHIYMHEREIRTEFIQTNSKNRECARVFN